uniref:Uncharacterized protein n=1 Tax=Bartonella schoenbuchensis (strain DSM 13525 / NCTC 13165 / R1) TaxID=687861 RepID=E6Z0D5_BARSR|nr:hypothetical protein B11C_40428 [Bartonella schoenbuchensis R1]
MEKCINEAGIITYKKCITNYRAIRLPKWRETLRICSKG